MKRLYAAACTQDTDYARFVQYYIEHSHEFYEQYSFHEAIAYLMISLPVSKLLLFNDGYGKLQGYIQYRYEEDSDTAFIDSTILLPAYRSSIVFYRGFVEWAHHVMKEQTCIRRVRFHVRADHAYLNRLYAKFARKVGEQDSRGNMEFVYEAAFDELLRYLRIEIK